MEITKIKVDQLSPKESGICGEFSLTFDDLLVVHKVLVINGKNGLFIAFPNNGEPVEINQKKRYTDLVHPTNQTFRQDFNNFLLRRYYKSVHTFNYYIRFISYLCNCVYIQLV